MDPMIVLVFQVVRRMLSVQKEHWINITKLADNLQETEDDWVEEDRNKNSLFEYLDGRIDVLENLVDPTWVLDRAEDIATQNKVKIMQSQVEATQKKLKEQEANVFKLEAETEFLCMWVKCLIVLVLCLVFERLCVYFL